MGNIFSKITEFWKKQEKPRKQKIIIIAAVALILIVGLSVLLGQTEYAVLYSGLEPAEAGAIYTKLEEMGVPVKVKGDTLTVPKSQVDTLRLTLSAEGIPQSGDNLDIMGLASSFGTTDMEKNAYYQFQLQSDLAKDIKKFDGIKDASVKITMAKDSAFVLSETGNQPASASVVLTLMPGKKLSNSEAETIRDYVARAIPKLDRNNITIADTNMNQYRTGEESAEGEAMNDVAEQLNMTHRMQTVFQSRVMELLSPVFGSDKLSVMVNAELDFDQAVSESVTFAPPVEGETTGLIVSQKLLAEKIVGAVDQAGQPGFDPNGATVTYPDSGAGTDDTYYKSTNEYNAEVNEVREQIKRAQGSVKNLSIAVIINNEVQQAETVLSDVSKLVAKGLGISEDNVAVSTMAFTDAKTAEQEAIEAANQLIIDQQTTQMYIIIGAAVLLILTVALILIFMGKANKKKQQQIIEQFESQYGVATAGGVNLVADDDLSATELLTPQEADSVKYIRALVESNPESIAMLLRNWLVN